MAASRDSRNETCKLASLRFGQVFSHAYQRNHQEYLGSSRFQSVASKCQTAVADSSWCNKPGMRAGPVAPTIGFAILVKIYGAAHGNPNERRYSPGECIGATKGTIGVSRRARARWPRISKNGTAEERAARARPTRNDPVFGLIEAGRSGRAEHLAALAEQNRLEAIGHSGGP